jgi:hypothetical protein
MIKPREDLTLLVAGFSWPLLSPLSAAGFGKKGLSLTLYNIK